MKEYAESFSETLKKSHFQCFEVLFIFFSTSQHFKLTEGSISNSKTFCFLSTLIHAEYNTPNMT